MRPLVTIVSDSLAWYGKDENGGRVHDLLGTRCDPYINTVLSGSQYDFHCHSNLSRAVAKWGLREDDVHDVLNLFQVTGLDDKGRYFMSPCPAEKGDSIEFLAEQDVLMALSMFLIFHVFFGAMTPWQWTRNFLEAGNLANLIFFFHRYLSWW